MSDAFQPAAESAPETSLNPTAEETAAPVENTSEATTGDNEDTADDAGAEGKPKGGFQKRIGELTANWRTTERERDHWREQAMRLLQQQNAHLPKQEGPAQPVQLPPDIAAHIGPAPDPSKYPAGEFDPRYTVDLAKYELKREGAEQVARQRQGSVQQMQQQFAARLDSIVEEGQAKFGQAEFDGAVNSIAALKHPQIGSVLREAIADCDAPADVAFALAKDKDAQEAIAKARTPAAVARVVGRVEARLQSAPPQPKPTAAPAPPPRLAKGAATASSDPAKMSADEYYNWRMKQV